MDAFLSTYRKDYRWPVLPPLKVGEHNNIKTSNCFNEPITPKFVKPDTQALQVSAVPQSANSKLNQPDTFLHQLYEKNPYLYNIAKAQPSDDVKGRILSQRFVSTYQNDYGTADSKVGFAEKDICCCKNNEGQEARFTSNQPITVPKYRVHLINSPAGKGDGGQTSAGELKHKPGVSEYTDSISKTGILIMKRKLLLNSSRKYHF